MAMAMQFVDVRSNDFPIFHFAPEQALQNVLLEKYGVRTRQQILRQKLMRYGQKYLCDKLT
jgi:hypothetical protein